MVGTCKYLNLNSKAGEAIFDEKTRNEIKNLSTEKINRFITHVLFRQRKNAS